MANYFVYDKKFNGLSTTDVSLRYFIAEKEQQVKTRILDRSRTYREMTFSLLRYPQRFMSFHKALSLY